MNDEGNIFLKTLKDEKTINRPFWFMRQAGRFLPEFRETRKKAGSFFDLCFNPELAAEVTLQPVRRFGMDAAIIFSDILVVPHAMGVEVKFVEGFGPDLQPLDSIKSLGSFDGESLKNSYKAMRIVRNELDKNKVMIGFAGAPFTVSCYMVDGNSKDDFAKTKIFAKTSRTEFLKLLDVLSDATIEHLGNQIEAGAEVVQIFDSWAALADNDEDYNDFIVRPSRKIADGIRKKYPYIYIIGFPRGSGKRYEAYSKKAGVDVVGIDEKVDVKWADSMFPKEIGLQGNLDNMVFASDGKKAVEETRRILESLRNRRHIFNLGHGVLPETPIENAMLVSETVKNFRL